MEIIDSKRRKISTSVVCPIVYGSVAVWLGNKKKADDAATHSWVLFVRGPKDEDLSMFISHVAFSLHPSFPEPIRIIRSPPFEVTESGWGEFEAGIRIFFRDPSEQPVDLLHSIRLYHANTQILSSTKPVVAEAYDEIVFTDPHEEFFNCCLVQYTRADVGTGGANSSTIPNAAVAGGGGLNLRNNKQMKKSLAVNVKATATDDAGNTISGTATATTLIPALTAATDTTSGTHTAAATGSGGALPGSGGASVCEEQRAVFDDEGDLQQLTFIHHNLGNEITKAKAQLLQLESEVALCKLRLSEPDTGDPSAFTSSFPTPPPAGGVGGGRTSGYSSTNLSLSTGGDREKERGTNSKSSAGRQKGDRSGAGNATARKLSNKEKSGAVGVSGNGSVRAEKGIMT